MDFRTALAVELTGRLAELRLLLQSVDPPANLVTFLWIALGALASALAYLFRLLAVRYDKAVELVEKQHAMARETNEALRDVAESIRSLERAINLDGSLREALARDRRRDGD